MSVHHIQDTPERICKALLETIWAHDPGTAQHCQRVGRMAAEFLEFIGCTHEEIHEGGLGGMIHDLGKVGVPIDLLNKAGALTPKERKRLEGHALWGRQIVRSLRGMPGMDKILDVVEYHHEKWTGLGYPTHIKADNIPFLARAVSIVDAFDAMTSKRAYGTPKSVPAALLEVQNGGGTQFDPQLATQFVAWMRTGRVAAPKKTAA